MKFPKLLSTLVICFFSTHFFCQITTFTTSSSLCVSQTVLATASSTIPSSTIGSYSWSISPAESIVSVSAQNSVVIVSYTACGNHTLYCSTLDNSSLPIANANASFVVNVICSSPPVVSIGTTASSVCVGFMSTLVAFGANNYTWYPGGSSQTLSVGPGSYTVVGADANGCMGVDSIFIGALPSLNIATFQSSIITCITNNSPKFSKIVTFSATGASTYAWFPYNEVSPPLGPTTSVRPIATRCYTVIGSTSTCSGSAVLCLTVTPQFSINVNPPLPIICIGEQIALGVSSVGLPSTGPASAFSYSWTEALNAPPISISNYFTPTVSVFPQNTTTYSVEVRDAVNCVSLPRPVTVMVNICTGLDNARSNEFEILVYPNPVNEKLYIRHHRSANLIVEIADISGKIIIREDAKFNAGTDHEINTSSLAKGIYCVKVRGDIENTRTFRIIKH